MQKRHFDNRSIAEFCKVCFFVADLFASPGRLCQPLLMYVTTYIQNQKGLNREHTEVQSSLGFVVFYKLDQVGEILLNFVFSKCRHILLPLIIYTALRLRKVFLFNLLCFRSLPI